MELDIRLGILKDAGQIDEDVYRNVIKVISIFRDRWSIDLKEENGAMLITHLSIALQRVKNNCPVEKIDEEIYEEVKQNQYFQTSEKALRSIKSEMNMDIPESEKSFLIMHLCALFEKENIEKLGGN
ncbi:PRD domain-containing protein [Clostridium sp. CF012]|uniref:PRD domain-containing protein n=1 Tax=Clostridium sp. CF012 TaxID=2843319 RepID=UPI001C0D2CCE|nr:PRD domain-containing protein [Clostridium sp. CF012]MBU3145821.1 PRD domain-containing protein [Clostridium sp. CF012]